MIAGKAISRPGASRTACEEVEKCLPEIVRDRDILLTEDDAVALYGADFRRLDDVGAVDADETFGRELFFQRFEAQQRQDGMRLVFDVDLDVILQSFDIENPIQLDLLQARGRRITRLSKNDLKSVRHRDGL